MRARAVRKVIIKLNKLAKFPQISIDLMMHTAKSQRADKMQLSIKQAIILGSLNYHQSIDTSHIYNSIS